MNVFEFICGNCKMENSVNEELVKKWICSCGKCWDIEKMIEFENENQRR